MLKNPFCEDFFFPNIQSKCLVGQLEVTSSCPKTRRQSSYVRFDQFLNYLEEHYKVLPEGFWLFIWHWQYCEIKQIHFFL